MRGTRRKIGAFFVACMLVFLTGCGDEMYPLTEEEENTVVTYAAHIVAKYNKSQTEGLVYIAPEPEEEKVKEDVEEPVQEPEAPQESADASQPQQPETTDQQVAPEEMAVTASVNEALGLGEVEAVYQGYEVKDHYVEGDYYSVDANAGKRFVVMHFDLTNKAAEAMNCDILSAGPVFTLQVNGSSRVEADTTILLDDLSTLSTNLEPGQTVQTVLLFQVSDEVAEEIRNIDLSVYVNQTEYQLGL